ncbi:MAG: biotin/lipoyl-containing protein, partial [Angustibacter sp.]
MTEHVKMPALGESVTEGTVTRWLKQVGDSIAVDEPLLEVSTDKVDTEIPAPVAGVLERILVAEDETVPVGADLAVIGTAASAAPPPSSPANPAPFARESPLDRPASPTVSSLAASAPVLSAPVSNSPVAPAPAAPAPSGVDASGTPVLMPALGESVTEGTVTRWLKASGDHISADEPLLEVSTDKVDT